MASMGVRKFDDLVGRSDLLDTRAGIEHWKARGLDFSRIFYMPPVPAEVSRLHSETQDHGIDRALDHSLIAKAKDAIETGKPVVVESPITNVNRTAGTMLSHEVARRYGHKGLPDNTIMVKLSGTAGQSFGAFIARGITLELTGQGNDYVAKGLSGGRIVIKPSDAFRGASEKNIIVGNTVLYGATEGECYFRGVAGERFAVRNSGAIAVVEGTGDHGCEYMTGGTVVVLGQTGRNFAAGMSGGVAYVYDEDGSFAKRCNMSMVELDTISGDLANDADDHIIGEAAINHLTMSDEAILRRLIARHAAFSGSKRAADILADWANARGKFVKVMPVEYRRALREMAAKADAPAAAMAK